MSTDSATRLRVLGIFGGMTVLRVIVYAFQAINKLFFVIPL